MVYLSARQLQTSLNNEIPAYVISEEEAAERVVNKPISCHKITVYYRRDNGSDNIMKQRHITSVTTFINYQPTSHIPCK